MAFGGACVTMEVHASFTVQAVLPVPVQPAASMIPQEVEDDADPWAMGQPEGDVREVSPDALSASALPEVDF